MVAEPISVAKCSKVLVLMMEKTEGSEYSTFSAFGSVAIIVGSSTGMLSGAFEWKLMYIYNYMSLTPRISDDGSTF